MLGARKNGEGNQVDSAFSRYRDDYTQFDKDAFKICYSRPLGNDDSGNIEDYDPIIINQANASVLYLKNYFNKKKKTQAIYMPPVNIQQASNF